MVEIVLKFKTEKKCSKIVSTASLHLELYLQFIVNIIWHILNNVPP